MLASKRICKYRGHDEWRFTAGSIKIDQFSDLDITGTWPSSGKTGKEQRPGGHGSNCSCMSKRTSHTCPAGTLRGQPSMLGFSRDYVLVIRDGQQHRSWKSLQSSHLNQIAPQGHCLCIAFWRLDLSQPCVCVEETLQTQAVNWMRLGWICPHTVLSLPFLCNVPSRKYF